MAHGKDSALSAKFLSQRKVKLSSMPVKSWSKQTIDSLTWLMKTWPRRAKQTLTIIARLQLGAIMHIGMQEGGNDETLLYQEETRYNEWAHLGTHRNGNQQPLSVYATPMPHLQPTAF